MGKRWKFWRLLNAIFNWRPFCNLHTPVAKGSHSEGKGNYRLRMCLDLLSRRTHELRPLNADFTSSDTFTACREKSILSYNTWNILSSHTSCYNQTFFSVQKQIHDTKTEINVKLILVYNFHTCYTIFSPSKESPTPVLSKFVM